MATILETNLYPPIIDTYMPAFLASTKECNIYFGLSNFNSFSSEVHPYAQVTVTMQRSNKNAINVSGNVNTGIYFLYIHQDPLKTGDDKYYVTLNDSILKEDFASNIDQYYKIQIRLMKKDNIPASELSSEAGHERMASPSFLNNYLEYFSEWSTVCLIRPISDPELKIDGFGTTNNSQYVFKDNFLNFTGKLFFNKISETERLNKYKLTLIKGYEILEESPILYSGNYNNKNAMYYRFNINFSDADPADVYKLSIYYETNNKYTKTETIEFIIDLDQFEDINYNLSLVIDEEQGQNILTPIKMVDDDITNFFLVYVRTSNKSNFTVWEVIGIKDDHSPFYDRSIESGIWYEYGIQRVIWVQNSGNTEDPSRYMYDRIGAVTQTTIQGNDHSLHGGDPLIQETNIYTFVQNDITHIGAINNFDDEFINADNKQLKVKYDSLPTSFKRVVSENKIDTIGSQYPFIRRNSAVNYKQFSIRGLITVQDEDNDIFISDVKLYNGNLGNQLYQEFNMKNQIFDSNNYVKEREYREKIIDFLYSDNIKLVRNLTEGNVIGKIMDINLTPNATLGNLVYSFTGTLYEIDNFSLENIYKYGISSIPITLQQAIKAYGSKKGVTNNG